MFGFLIFYERVGIVVVCLRFTYDTCVCRAFLDALPVSVEKFATEVFLKSVFFYFCCVHREKK